MLAEEQGGGYCRRIWNFLEEECVKREDLRFANSTENELPLTEWFSSVGEK